MIGCTQLGMKHSIKITEWMRCQAKRIKKKSVVDWVGETHKRLSDFHLEIWNYAESAWREFRSAKAHVAITASC
jgi:hypothetical protein